MDAPAHTSALFRRVEASFRRQGLMQHLGVRLLRVETGLCEVALSHLRQRRRPLNPLRTGAKHPLTLPLNASTETKDTP